MTSKHDAIAGWLAMGLSTTEVAKIVDCTVTYARAVRNRVRNKQKHGSITYPSEAPRRRERFKTDPEYAAARRRWQATYKAKKQQAQP